MALDENGVVYSWGDQQFEQCGHNYSQKIEKYIKNDEVLDYKYLKPRPMNYFIEKQIKISKIFCGGNHSLALDSENNLFAWGHNHLGQCGVKSKTTQVKLEVPHLVDFGIEENYIISQVAAGADHTLVLVSFSRIQENTQVIIHEHKLFAFGNNQQGQLGMKDTVNYKTPR